jgi:cytochrome b561
VALLLAQFPIGWLMPDIHAGPPGAAMTFHISFGILIRMPPGGAALSRRLNWRCCTAKSQL